MFDVVLFRPEIPPNTGNVIRLCANAGCRLHLVGPLGFELDDARLRRAGLDYREWATVREHDDMGQLLSALGDRRLFAFSTRHALLHTAVAWRAGDAMLFGGESGGLPQPVRESVPPSRRVRVPMVPGNRSLNLSNAVAVAVFEAWRQLGFEGGA